MEFKGTPCFSSWFYPTYHVTACDGCRKMAAPEVIMFWVASMGRLKSQLKSTVDHISLFHIPGGLKTTNPETFTTWLYFTFCFPPPNRLSPKKIFVENVETLNQSCCVFNLMQLSVTMSARLHNGVWCKERWHLICNDVHWASTWRWLLCFFMTYIIAVWCSYRCWVNDVDGFVVLWQVYRGGGLTSFKMSKTDFACRGSATSLHTQDAKDKIIVRLVCCVASISPRQLGPSLACDEYRFQFEQRQEGWERLWTMIQGKRRPCPLAPSPEH